MRGGVAVELVVARHVDDSPAAERLRRPLDATYAQVCVAGEHHGIRLHLRWIERSELEVQVAQDVKAQVIDRGVSRCRRGG